MAEVSIQLYEPKYKQDFIRLNKEWITTYFELEKSDIEILENVKDIISNGGQIFVALSSKEVVGCCALVRHKDSDTHELAKMAVSPAAQGLGIGRMLGEALVGYARKSGVKRLFLEGNTKMEASIILYRKLGFEEVPIDNSAYKRCNIMMLLDL